MTQGWKMRTKFYLWVFVLSLAAVIAGGCMPQRSYNAQEDEAVLNGVNRIIGTIQANQPAIPEPVIVQQPAPIVIETGVPMWIVPALAVLAIVVLAGAFVFALDSQRKTSVQVAQAAAATRPQARPQLPAGDRIAIQAPNGDTFLLIRQDGEHRGKFLSRVSTARQLYAAEDE